MSCVLRPLPQYRSITAPFTVVQALRIRDMTLMPRDGMLIIPFEPDMPPFEVSADWVELHEPRVGGYWMSYPDGFTGHLMAELFEQQYEKI